MTDTRTGPSTFGYGLYRRMIYNYNHPSCPLQSRLWHIYHGHGQPYARVDFIPHAGTLDWASDIYNVGLEILQVHTRKYWRIYRRPGFLAVVLFGSPSSPAGKLDGATQRKTEKERRLADGRRGEEGAESIRPQESLVLYKSFNTLWSVLTRLLTVHCGCQEYKQFLSLFPRIMF